MNWVEDKQKITEKYFEAINLNNLYLFGIIKDNFTKIDSIFPLIEFILSRLETVTTLTIDNKLWDAEIILRSALETLVKLIFITSAEKDQRSKRIDEYWNLLSEINSIKLSDQAKRNLEYYGESEMHRLAFLPIILDEKLEQELRLKWTKSERQKIEQKWSFNEMVMSISKSNKGKPLEMLITLTQTYRICSHVMHGDETGISIIQERNSRSNIEQDKANRGHFLRLLDDSFSYCFFVAIEIMGLLELNKEKEFFVSNYHKLKEVEDLIVKYRGKVYDDKDYDKYRTSNN